MTVLTDEAMKKQESLSPEFLKLLAVAQPSQHAAGARPKESLAELMSWARAVAEPYIDSGRTEQRQSSAFINNTITIDGSFLLYCKENNIKVKCLFRDSVATWKDEYDVESFIAQGIFLIEHEGLQFVHAALFHKGNQNEDEVSFFIIIQDGAFHKYVEFRNKYEKWTEDRVRSNSEVRVIGGEDFPYTKDYGWDSVFLPTKLKDEIKNNIEGFLKSEELYKKARIAWKKGMLLWGEPGVGKSTLLRTIMSSYDIKPVTISIGGHASPDDLIEEAFSYASHHAPSLLFLEDINVLLTEYINVSHFLQLMDGVNSKSGILVVGTANDISGLSNNITDRPFRFDNKFELPLPDKLMATKYLKFWFKDIITDKNIYKELAVKVCKYKFSYAYIELLYVSAASMAINKNKSLDMSDIEEAMKLLINDKKDVKSDFKSQSANEIGIHTYEKQ